MIRDKRGEGGFMEAMLALMMVTAALTTFLGLLAYSEIGGSDDGAAMDTRFIEDLELIDGEIVGETEKEMSRFVEKNGLNGARLTVRIAGDLSDSMMVRSVGTEGGNNVGVISGTFSIRSNDGRVFAASYEVVYWWD